MFCSKCGHEIKDGAKFCPNCGAAVGVGENIKNAAKQAFTGAENELDSAISEVQDTLSGKDRKPEPDTGAGKVQDEPYEHADEKDMSTNVTSVARNEGTGGAGIMKEHLKDDRGLLSYIVLSIITCGIYGYYFVYKMAHDVNIACEGDDETTAGLVPFILLSFVTCGLYSFYWQYKLGNRLATNAPRFGLSFQENGTTILLWDIIGAFLCCLGPFVAMHILIKNSNAICNAYNRQNNI